MNPPIVRDRLRPLVVVLTILLGGCWEGPVFYAASESVPAIEPGRYRAIAPEQHDEVAHILVGSDGMTRIEGDDPDDSYGFRPVDSEGRRFVMWVHDARQEGDETAYALLERSGPGAYLIYHPRCDGADAEVAISAGAQRLADRAVPTCRFPDRASLESAIRNLHPVPATAIRLVRLPDGGR